MTKRSIAIVFAVMSMSGAAPPIEPAGKPVDEQRPIEPVLAGSELTVTEAKGKADVVEVGTLVKMLDCQIGALGVLRCTCRVDAGQTLKGGRPSRDTIDFEVSAWRKETPPAVQSKYILFIKTVGVDRPTAIKIVVQDEGLATRIADEYAVHGEAAMPNNAQSVTTSPAVGPATPHAATTSPARGDE
jgi:hypothetical protein